MKNDLSNTEVQQERDEIKKFAKSLPIEKFKNGEWFPSLVNLALKTYREKVTAQYFKDKYPGLPADGIIDRRIQIAKKHTALEGGSTALAYSGAIAATIGSKGGASPFTIPAAVGAIAIDLCYTSYTQLRLAYDISVLYGKPLDFEDPEDMQDLLIIAFGIKAGESFQVMLQKLVPEITRVTIKNTLTGKSLIWIQALPVVGKYLLQRSIIKMAIPVVAVGVSSTLNYYFSDKIGKRAKSLFRSRVSIEEYAKDFSFSDIEYIPLLLAAVWLVIKADGQTKQEEAWYLKYLIENLQEIEGTSDYILSFSERINFSETKIFQEIAMLPTEIKQDIFEAASMAAIMDRKLDNEEELFLSRLSVVCESEFQKDKLLLAVKDLQ